MANVLDNNASVFRPKKDEQKKIETPVIKQASIPAAVTGALRALSTGTSNITPFTKNTSASVSKPAAKTTQPSLSSQSIQNDKRKGIDWSSASPAQRAYNDTYYKTLDEPAHTKMFRDLQSFTYRTAGGADVDKSEAFRKSYKEGTTYLDNELKDYEQRYGKDSYEYKALQQFKGDYESLGRQVETKRARENASAYSSQLDQNIQQIYGGLMAQPDFQAKVDEGRELVQKSSQEYRNFERMTENASDLQKNLLLYIRATEGNKGVQQFMASGLGELLTATRAADIYSRTIENDSEAFRKAAIGAQRFFGSVGNAIPGTIELAKGITGSDKDDPDDKNLGGGYTISDSTDNYLQTTLAKDFEQAGVTNEQFKYVAELGGSALKTEAGSTDWYKDFEKNASDYQKQVISFLYASSGEEAAKAMWEGIKDREQQVWDSVKRNSNRLATSVDEDLDALYQQYAHDFGHAAPGFLASVGGEGVTWEELLLQATGSAAEQVIPMLLGNLVGGAFRAAGATKKATNWASRIASATPMATMIGGRGYGEALDKGVSRGKAMGYGITEASLEFITGMLLDGAAGVGGKLTGDIRDKAVAKIASPVLRALADAGIRSWGEGAEEYVQEALEPIIASVFLDEGELVDALGETFDPRNILDPDRLYAGFLGALTALGMAPGNVAMDIHNNNYYKALGKGFNTINATVKAADVIINNPVEGPDSDSELYEDSKKTAEIIKNGGKVSDLAAGKMIVDYGSAGGDMSAITGLDTMTYNKDSIGYDDYVAGIRSVLVDMNEDVALAEDLAKLATGQTITEEAQTRINESKAAQDILSQLQGDLDMEDGKSALTRAARATVFRGTMNKIFQTLKNENPDKTVVSPATQQLLNTGLDVNAAQKIGAVIDKVLNGEAITEAEAALVKASSPAIRATVLNTLDIELSEYANKQAVMQALNDFATEAARIKEQQAAVRQGAQPAAQARGAAMQGGLTNGIQGNDTGAAGQGENRSVQEGPQNSGAATGSPSATGQAPADLGRSGQRSGRNQRNAGQVHAEVTEERKQDVKRGCVESGADTVKFVVDEDSCTFYDPDDGYVIKIKTNGQFTIEQYGQHEPIHLWVTYALSEDHRKEVLDDFSQQFTERFGEDFHDKLYNFIEKVYGEKGYLPADEDAAMYQILEDMLSFCYAGQNYGMDLTACRQFARQFVEDHGLKAIGTGDFSNQKVQEALANGWINPEYYERHGWSQEDDGTSLDISTEEAPVEQSEETPAEEPGAAERKKITDYLRKNDLEKMRKNLAKQRKLLVENARKNGDNKPGSPNYKAHRARVAELEAQIKDVESQLAELNAQHSADYEEETNEAVNTRGVQSSAPGEKTGVSQAKQKSDSVQKPKKDLRRKSPEQLQESRDLHEEEVNNLIDEDHEIVPYEQVPEEYRWITDSFAEVAPESEVTYYRDSSEDAPNMYYLPAIVKGADGGFFVNLAKLEEGEWRDDGWTLDNMVLHEKAHFWLDKAGGLAETAWRKLRGKFFVNPNQFGKFADILKAYREWCSDFYHDAEEELVCDVLGGRSIAWDWYAPELWPEARQVMQNFFSANTEYALSKEAETVDEKKSYSADYDPEYYQSIGLIDPEGQTVAFTDNIGGVHEEIINQLNGNPGEDIKDFIARGGIRVKPGSGIEVNGDIAPSVAQYDMIDKIVENFTGKEFSIDFNIDGVSAGTHTFEGADLDPNRVYSYLRNYYERRKADKVRDEKLDRFSETLGMRVKSMADAYNLAEMVARMEGMTPELQEIIDTYEGGRYSADYAENFDTSEYLELKTEGFDIKEDVDYDNYIAAGGPTDLDGAPITEDVKNYFSGAQSYDENLDEIVNNIISLFLATDYLGFSAYDPSGKSDDGRSIFLTDSRIVGASYAQKGNNLIDMKALGALREHIAKELGYEDFDDLPLPIDADDETLAKMYNAALSYKGKLDWFNREGRSPIKAAGKGAPLDESEAEQHLRALDELYVSLEILDPEEEFTETILPSLELVTLYLGQIANADADDLTRDDLLDTINSCKNKIEHLIGKLLPLDHADLTDTLSSIAHTLFAVETAMPEFVNPEGKAVSRNDVLNLLADSGSWAVYANTTKPLVLPALEYMWNSLEGAIDDQDWANDFWEWYRTYDYAKFDYSVNTRAVANYAYERGYDSAIILGIYDTGGYGGHEARNTTSNIYVVFNPNQIKSVNNKHPSGDKRMNYSADYANPESEDYLGPNIDEVTRMRAQEEDIYRNQDIWKQEAEEKEADEDAIVSETTLDEDIREAREDALLAELMQGDLTPERQKELYAEYLQLQQAGINYTKHAPKQEEEAKPAPKKSPVAQAFRPKAEVEQKKKEPVKVTPKAKPAPESELQQLQREFEAAKATSDDDVDPDLLARVSAALERANIQYAEDMEREAQVAQKAEAAAQAVAEAKKPKTVKVKAKAKPVIPVAQTTETEAKPEVVVFKNDGTKFTKISKNERKSKNPKYIQNIGNAKTIEIRRRRSDRNTYDVRFNDGKGNIVAYEEISPAALTKAFAFATGDRDTAKARAGEAMAMASEPSLSWSLVPNPKVVKATEAKPEEVRATDNYGRSVPVKLTKYLENSAIRTEDGALINTYRLAPANGVHNAKMPGKVSMYTERPAPINTMRGMKGAEAFGQSGKGVAEQLSEWLDALTNPEITPKRTEEIRRQIVETEQQMRKYTNGVTRLDPNRPGYEFATPENVVNGKSLVETYLDIRKPKVIDAKGKGVDFIQQEVQKFIRDPANKAGLFDAQKNPIGPHDGFKFLNARIIPEGETLGGGEADLDTVYVTLRNNQAKSTYNTAPTDSDLIQYSADYDNAMIEEEDMRGRGILERKGEGFSDAHGNWISPEQANHFEMAKMIDQNGNLVYGIIPLFHGGRTIYFRFDPSKSTYPWFYLTTNPRVAKGYDDGGPKEVVDLKLREKLFRRLAKAMNLGNPSAALKAFKEQILSGPAEQQNQAAQKYADIINSYLRDGGKLYDKYDDKYVEDISSINAIPVNKQEFEQRLEDSMATLDDQLLLLGDAMGDLEDKMDAYKGRPERKQMDEYHALLDDLYYYAQSVLDSAKDGTAVSDDFNAWPLVLAEPITDSETGEVLVDTHALADGIIGSIRSSADTVKDRVEDLNDLQPSFEVRYKDGGYEQLMFEELPSLAAKGGATAFYANITNPLVVDGTTRDGKTGRWTALDITGIPEMLKLFPDGKAETDDVADWARGHGYDGVIIRNIYDTATGDDRPGFEGDDYIVFDSSKVKSVNNRTPTSGPLFNYSADYADIDTGYTEGTLEDTIIKILRDKDIDRASAALAEYMANFLQTGVLPQMENERTQNIFQPRIGESQRKLLEEQLRKDIAKYGEIEPGEKPAREIHFPKQTEQGVVRRTLRTVAESKNVPDRMIPAVMRDIVQGRGDDRTVVYQRMTDKAAVAYADREMRKKGYDAARAEWQGKRDQDSKVTKNDIALGELVMIEAAKAGDVDTALTTAAELAEAATNAGQVVQAIRLIKSMPASYQLYYFQRVANRLNRQYSKRIKSGKMDELKVDRDLAKAVINAKTDKDLETAINNLIQSLADQIPATMADKWNAWRYLAMLGNPKTHIRNILGNGIFVPAKFAKDLIKAGLEGVIVKDPNQRTSSLRGLIGAPSEYRNFAEKDYEGIKKDLQAGGKYNPTNDIMQKRTIFGNKFLEWLRKINGNALEAEDGKFLKFHYVNALTNFLATRGVSVEALESTPDGAKVLNAARQYAFSEALKATYRDASSIASALNMIKRTNPTAGILLDGLVPFTKTPINILKRGIEYSPIGLLGSVTRGLAQLKNGDIDANQFCDNLAAGLTGTGIAILGFWLTSLGVLKGGDDDDDKKADFDKLMGYQNYSINIGGQNFTIDWAAPSALPLFVGSAMFTELAESNGLTFADIFNASTVIAEPLTQLSMLSGINDALKSAKWDENPLSSVISSMATGYVSQGVPTWLAQIARTGAVNRRTTYVDKNSDIPPAIQRWAQTNILGKVPGLNNKRAEYIDAWGRKDTEKNALVRLFDNMFAPWYRNEINITPVDKELMRLSEETGTSVLMSPADRYIEFDNQKHDLTAQQYETYAKVRGQRTFEMLGELFNSMAYQKGMTEEEKAKAVEFIKQYGNILGKQAVFPEYETDNDNWAEKCDGDTTRLLDMAMAKAQANALDITAGNNGEFYQMVMNTDWMSPVEQGYIIAQQYNTTSETVYARKGGPKYELTNDRKDQLYEYYRLIFPEYYLQLVGTTAWQNADNEKRLEMLSKVRSDVGGIAKAWLAERLQAAGAPVYTGK